MIIILIMTVNLQESPVSEFRTELGETRPATGSLQDSGLPRRAPAGLTQPTPVANPPLGEQIPTSVSSRPAGWGAD